MSKTPDSLEIPDRIELSGRGRSAIRKPPSRVEQEPSAIEAFEEKGAGIAPKE